MPLIFDQNTEIGSIWPAVNSPFTFDLLNTGDSGQGRSVLMHLYKGLLACLSSHRSLQCSNFRKIVPVLKSRLCRNEAIMCI